MTALELRIGPGSGERTEVISKKLLAVLAEERPTLGEAKAVIIWLQLALDDASLDFPALDHVDT